MNTVAASATASQRLQALIEHAPVAFAIVRDECFEVVSDPMHQLLGCHDDQGLVGAGTRGILATEAAAEGVHERLLAAARAHQPFLEEVECRRRDGGRFWGRLQATPVNWAEPAGEALWWLQDVTAERQKRHAPTWGSAHDALTELANRREFERRVADHTGSHRREPVSVLWLDIDRFAAINDKLGQGAGDQLLVALSRLFVGKLRTNDLVARLEADRFGLLLPSCDHHYAQLVAEKLRDTVAGYRLRWATRSTRMTASVGVVQIDSAVDSVDDVMKAAEQACQAAKQAGGDSVRVHMSPQLAASAAG